MAISPPKKPKPKRSSRINLKALAYFGGLVVLIGVLYFPVKMLSDRKARSSALAQAKLSAEKGDVNLALRHLNRYLEAWPNDVPALEEKARLVSESARSPDQFLEAANLDDLLVRLDPSGPNRRETRRKMAEAYIRYSDAARVYAAFHPDQAKAAEDTRYIAAIQVARKLVEEDRNDATAHRLLAMALDGQAAGDAKGRNAARKADPGGRTPKDARGVGLADQLAEAESEYLEALRIDPRDVLAAERLADLYLDRLKDPAEAEKTVDAMLKANPDSVPVRLSRYRVFNRAKQPEKARAELEAAVAMDPSNVLIRAEAASEAIGRRDTAAARRQLDAIPADRQDTLRVRYLRGLLDTAEQHPDEAVEEWRKGLSIAGGTDADLTWALARALIQLGRLGEAKPLVAQFQRLDKDDASGRGRLLRSMFEQRAGRPALAIENLEKVSDRVDAGLKAEVQILTGRCYEELGDESRALIAYRRASTLMPQSPYPRRLVARVLQARDPEQAIAELELALDQTPGDLPILSDLIRMRIVRQLVRPAGERRWNEVGELLDRAEKLAPTDTMFHELRAEYLADSGQIDRAVELLGRVAQGPGRKYPESWQSWAAALERTGRRDEAIRVLERASKPEEAGDRASLRIGRARLLVRSGQGQAARDLLSKDRQAVPAFERPELSRELAEMLQLMGDRDGARDALAEWARLVPDSPRPALMLLNLAQVNADDEAARLGLEALRHLGGDQEPYGLAAQALERLRPDRSRPGPPSAGRLEEADRLATRLVKEAPHLALGHLLKGMILEQQGKLEASAAEYRLAMKDDGVTLALPRLVEILAKLKRFDELDALKQKVEEQAAGRQPAAVSAEFERVSAGVALKLGDTTRAEFHAAQVVQAQPDNIPARTALAQLLDRLGKPKEAEAALQAIIDRKPKEPAAWLALVAFQAPRRPKADVLRTIEKVRADYKGERPELLLAQCHWVANDQATAETLFKDALARRPDDLATLRGVAEFAESTGRGDQLEAALKAALKVDPRATWASRSLALRISARTEPTAWEQAWALVAPGAPGSGETPDDRLVRATLLARCPENARRAEAIPAFASLANDLPAASPQGLDARLRLAQAMLEIRRADDAWSYIAPVADDVNRPNPAALAIAVEALVLSGRPEEAARRLDRLVAVEPKSARTAWARARVLRARDKKAEAAAAVESAYADAEGTPEGQAVAVSSVDLLVSFGDVETAVKVARKAAARWPALAWLLARLQFALKDYDEALASCRIALDAGSSRDALRFATSSAIARRSDPKFLKEVEAIGVEARAKNPGDFHVLVFLATVYHLQDRYEEEVALYREALGLNPPNVQFLNNMAWTLCEGLHKPEEALNRIDEAIRREGPNPQYLDTRGVIRGRLGLNDQAIADLELSVKVDPSPTTYYHLARAYLKANRPDDLRRCRDLALKARFDATALDPTDRAEMDQVMGKP